MASNSSVIIAPPTHATSVDATNDIRAIKPPVDIRSGWEWLVWTAGAIAILLALIIIARRWIARRRRPIPAAVVPPHVRALERLQAALALLRDPREFCIEVSGAIRIYLEERFSLRAPERTTEEFLRDLQTTQHLTAEQKKTLAEFLERCDLVKFARFEPDETALRELHETALRLIHETRYVERAQSAPSGADPVLTGK